MLALWEDHSMLKGIGVSRHKQFGNMPQAIKDFTSAGGILLFKSNPLQVRHTEAFKQGHLAQLCLQVYYFLTL